MIKAKITPYGEKWIKENKDLLEPNGDYWLAGSVCWIRAYINDLCDLNCGDKTSHLSAVPFDCVEIIHDQR